MNFYVMTLFPDMVINCLSESITGRAIKNGLINVEAVNIRDFATNKYKHVDDYIYGGGSGMLMQAEPVYLAYKHIMESMGNTEKTPRVLYMTPQGKTLTRVWHRSFHKKKI